MSLLTLFGCNDPITETTTSSTSQISHQQSLSLNVSNRVDETEMSNLELLFVFDVCVFDVVNQDETFVVRVQDVLGREVAGFHQGEAFQVMSWWFLSLESCHSTLTSITPAM
ncbi:hypothetical protein [Vibrio sp. D173a]|uniref:hypothetical protein n=1 Tax=Vibrio sp. D173a TaxID=2836349 RepID=UPI00255345E8|nr:hypothetical protein [Vibrio sp. D173a]